MPPGRVLACRAGNMTFRKTGDAGGKIARLADEIHQLRGIFKTAGRGLEFATAGRVAAQGQDVFAVERTDFVQQDTNLRASVVDAGKVGERRQAVFALDAIHDLQGFFARAAAGTVSDGTEVGPRRQQRGDLLFKQRAVDS